ncbi:MAG: flagellar biosynthetic protein FliR, partial [Burkholderiaceae bacterium]
YAVSAAAPVMVALLLTNVALGILSRAVPQLNAMTVSFPLSIGVGLLMFSVSLPIVASVITGWLHGMPEDVRALLSHLQL